MLAPHAHAAHTNKAQRVLPDRLLEALHPYELGYDADVTAPWGRHSGLFSGSVSSSGSASTWNASPRRSSSDQSDSGISSITQSSRRKPTFAMRSSYAVGAPDRDIYGLGSDLDDRAQNKVRGSRTQSPAFEHPSWGFVSSRAPSRMEDNGFDSEDDDGDSDDLGGSRFSLAFGSRVPSRLGGNIKKKKKGLRSRKNSFAPGKLEINASSKFKEKSDNYKATKITLFKNGDPWFGNMEFRFLPGRDLNNLDGLFQQIANKMDFTHGVHYMFDTEGARITSIDQIEEGGTYVCSQSPRFINANYGRTGDAFSVDGAAVVPKLTKPKPFRFMSISKGKSPSSSSSSSGKPGSGDGRIIKIVNAQDHTVAERVLLNMKTTQPFEDVIADLGQVLQMDNATKLYTKNAREIKSFSHLRNDFYMEDTFLVSAGPTKVKYMEPPPSDDELDMDDDGDDYDQYPGRQRSLFQRHRSETNLAVSSVGGRYNRTRSLSRSPSRNDSDQIRVIIHGNRKTLYVPTNGVKENPKAPSEKLELDWVFGYRCRDVKRNLWLLATGELLFFVGSVVVIYHVDLDHQRHYKEHTNEIRCMDLHPETDFVVSGQRAGSTPEARAHIRVWKSSTLETISVLGMGECENGISAVAFSIMNKGAFAMAVIEGKENPLSVWDWKKKEVLGRVATNCSSVNGCAFHPLDNNLIITFGKGHLVFWNRRKDGYFDRTDVLRAGSTKSVRCVTFLESGDLVVGDDSGKIGTYTVSNEGDYYMSHEFQAHSDGAVNCLIMLNESTLMSGGEKDRQIISWDVTREFARSGDTKLPDTMGSPRCVVPQKTSQGGVASNVYVGTSANSIIEGSLQRRFTNVVWGHSGKVNCIAADPDDPSFVTVGDDKAVAKWRKQKVAWKVTTASAGRAVAYHPAGSVVAVGTEDGHLVVLDSDGGTHVATQRLCGVSINAVAYSKDGATVAAAAQNGTVYIHQVTGNGRTYKKYGKMAGGEKLINLDWNISGTILRTVSEEHNVTYYNVRTNRIERASVAFRDEDWLEDTAIVSHAVAGMWNNVHVKGDSDVTCVHAGNNRTLIAAGDSRGAVRLFRFPASSPRADFFEQKVLSQPVSAIRFLFDDLFVVAAAGQDASILRWKVKE